MIYHVRYLTLALVALLLIITYAVGTSKFRGGGMVTDMLVISPHPDDAVLCCTGVILDAIREGKIVRVVTMTDGEAHTKAAAAWFHRDEIDLTPAMLRRFGMIRKKEDIRALVSLGIPHTRIRHLGYPDGFLDEVYASQTPFTSPYTDRDSAYNRSAAYTRTSLIRDLTVLLTEYRPETVYLPDPMDGALDHRTVNTLMRNTLEETGFAGNIYRYVIHMPEAMSITSRPDPLTIPLTDAEVSQKLKAIRLYQTQMRVESEYLESFVSGMETFYP